MSSQSTFSVKSSHRFVNGGSKPASTIKPTYISAFGRSKIGINSELGIPTTTRTPNNVIHGSQKGMAIRSNMNAMADYH